MNFIKYSIISEHVVSTMASREKEKSSEPGVDRSMFNQAEGNHCDTSCKTAAAGALGVADVRVQAQTLISFSPGP